MISALVLAEIAGIAVAPSAGLASVALVTRSLSPARGRHRRLPPPARPDQQIGQPQLALAAAPVAELPPAAETRPDGLPMAEARQAPADR